MDITAMGVTVEIRRETPQELVFDVTGRSFGLLAQPHVHTTQSEA